MKRYGNLWREIISFQNLFTASRQARKNKRFRPNVLAFEQNIEFELISLQYELEKCAYMPRGYKTFYIHEPKKRLISAADYRDRVVHHALCQVISPIFERSFTYDSFANRVGFGSHRALDRFTRYARKYRYVLQCDIQKYFACIDHDILKQIIRRKIKCRHTLWLIDLIINHSNDQCPPNLYFDGDDLLTPISRRRGLPVGNLTSQLFANIYLNGLDHFVKETLKISAYVRYVDDFALFSNNMSELREARRAVEDILGDIRLKIHPIKSQLFECRIGASFLGFRVFNTHRRIRAENLRRAKRRIKRLQVAYRQGSVTLDEVSHSMQSWLAHLSYGDTWRLCEKILNNIVFSRSFVGK